MSKVYIIKVTACNNETYDDAEEDFHIFKVFSTKEKAIDYVTDYDRLAKDAARNLRGNGATYVRYNTDFRYDKDINMALAYSGISLKSIGCVEEAIEDLEDWEMVNYCFYVVEMEVE